MTREQALAEALAHLATVPSLADELPEGDPLDCAECPVALWLSERVGRVRMGSATCYFDDVPVEVPVPARIIDWIDHFDRTGERLP